MRRLYGASPLHLAGHVVLFGLVAFAAAELAGYREPRNLLIWVVAAVFLHDFLLVPLYSGLDRGVRVLPRRIVNRVRVPAALSGLLLLVYFPLILGRSDANYARNAGYEPTGYLGRWLLVCALMFAASGVVLAVRRRSTR